MTKINSDAERGLLCLEQVKFSCLEPMLFDGHIKLYLVISIPTKFAWVVHLITCMILMYLTGLDAESEPQTDTGEG